MQQVEFNTTPANESIENVQSFIFNQSVPRTLEDLQYLIGYRDLFHTEEILRDIHLGEWTVPRWAGKGDIVLFMHAKTANVNLKNISVNLSLRRAEFSDKEFTILSEWIERGLALHKRYGGKIFAIGQVLSSPEKMSRGQDENYHWGSAIYAVVDNVHILDNPVDISEFNDFIRVTRQGAITQVVGSDFEKLREIISKTNCIPDYYSRSFVSVFPFSTVNRNNWLQLTNEYRRRFLSEEQLRNYYVDYLLQELGDSRTFYRECRCRKDKKPDAFVDNIILFDGRYLPVEIKLSISSERNIKTQLSRYSSCDWMVLDTKLNKSITAEWMYPDRVLVIDRDGVHIFLAEIDSLNLIYELEDLGRIEDIKTLRDAVRSVL